MKNKLKKNPGNRKSRSKSKAKRTVRTENENRTDFLEAVNNAPDGKALFTDKTKGYYRFSKKFPAVVDSEGFRLNTKPGTYKKKLGCILTAVLCVIAFCIGFTAVKTGIIISKTPYEGATQQTAETEEIYIIRFDYDKWTADKTNTEKKWKEKGVTGLLIDIKSTDGTLPYDLSGESIKDILNELKKSGFDTYGYISCLKDKQYASQYPANCVLNKKAEGNVLYDSDGFAYINPFSEEGVNYIADIVESAAKLDFSYYVIDEVTLPIKIGNKTPYYSGYSGNKNEINNKLSKVANTLIDIVNSDRAIFITDIYGFYATDSTTGTRYEGKLFPLNCELRGVDLRISRQNTTGKDQLELISQIETLPDVFLLDGTSLAIDETPANIKLYAICDKEEDAVCLRASGIHNIIVDS